ncbi:MAG: diguanylate cyclase, partial [Planctomycetes bacterium]|nr:diguanylate cyclase [Planctomycetota bacterium]
GVANLHGLENKDAESLIRAADHALYEAKAAGKKKIAASAALSKPAPA